MAANAPKTLEFALLWERRNSETQEVGVSRHVKVCANVKVSICDGAAVVVHKTLKGFLEFLQKWLPAPTTTRVCPF